MNQILKDVIYSKGTQAHVDYLAEISGMNNDEKAILQYAHEGQTDLYAQEELGFSKGTFKDKELLMRIKVVLGVFKCIDRCMKADRNTEKVL